MGLNLTSRVKTDIVKDSDNKKIAREKTGLKDNFGNEIYENDYVSVLWKYRSFMHRGCAKVGKVVWDCRHRDWVVAAIILPEFSRPSEWGKADSFLLDEGFSDHYRIIEYNKNFDGEWEFSHFFSGGVEIPVTKKSDGAIYNPQNPYEVVKNKKSACSYQSD